MSGQHIYYRHEVTVGQATCSNLVWLNFALFREDSERILGIDLASSVPLEVILVPLLKVFNQTSVVSIRVQQRDF